MAYARCLNTRSERRLPSVIVWARREVIRRANWLHHLTRGQRSVGIPRARGSAVGRDLHLIAVLPPADTAAASLISAALPAPLGAPVFELIPPDTPPLGLGGALPAAIAVPVRGGTERTLAALQQTPSRPRPTTPTATARTLNSGRFSARLRQAQGRSVLPNGLASESSSLLCSEALLCPSYPAPRAYPKPGTSRSSSIASWSRAARAPPRVPVRRTVRSLVPSPCTSGHPNAADRTRNAAARITPRLGSRRRSSEVDGGRRRLPHPRREVDGMMA